MATVKARYLGGLRVECEHLQSGTKIVTDAPTDHHGKGQAFSPTDLCATSLGACAMTIIGIYAQANNIDVTGAQMEITKVMAANPRKIAKIEIIFTMPPKKYSQAEKDKIESLTVDCPVCLSLAPEVERAIAFVWQD